MPKADSVVFDITDLIKGEKSNFLFMRTDTYTLDTNQYLTVSVESGQASTHILAGAGQIF